MHSKPHPRPRPGYVYLMSSPAMPGALKVGHTYRPPHRRARELSGTSTPLPFEVQHCRFFWDAPRVERDIHARLAPSRLSSRREFFVCPVPQVAQLLDGYGHDYACAGLVHIDDDDWGLSREGLEEQWSWGEDQISDADPALRRSGWRRLERLSAQGWDQASWRLSDLVFRHLGPQGGIGPAIWILDAATAQGHPGAYLRASWLRSLLPGSDALALERFQEATRQLVARHAHIDQTLWPEGAMETLQAEQTLWPTHPHRVFQCPIAIKKGFPTP